MSDPSQQLTLINSEALASELEAHHEGEPLNLTSLSAPEELSTAPQGALLVCVEARAERALLQGSPPRHAVALLCLSRFAPTLRERGWGRELGPLLVIEAELSEPRALLAKLIRRFDALMREAKRGKCLSLSKEEPFKARLHPTALIDPSARLEEGVEVGPFVVVEAGAVVSKGAQLKAYAFVGEGALVGEGARLEVRASVLAGCVLKAGAVVGPGAVIGAEGFGLDERGLLPHLGRVEVGEGATVGALSCVDRATLGVTRIGARAQLDNLVQVGHNAQVDTGAVLCAQVGLAGGAHVGAHAQLGGQSGVGNRVKVGAHAQVAAQSGVTKSLEAGGRYSGHPAEPNTPRLRRELRLRRLVERGAQSPPNVSDTFSEAQVEGSPKGSPNVSDTFSEAQVEGSPEGSPKGSPNVSDTFSEAQVEGSPEGSPNVSDTFSSSASDTFSAPPLVASIHPSASIHPTARLGVGVEVGEGVKIGAEVTLRRGAIVGAWSELERGCVVEPYGVVGERTLLKEGCVVSSFAVVGATPQVRAQPGDVPNVTHEGSFELICGPRAVFREGCTVSRGAPQLGEGVTRIGEGCLLMAYSHVGHDSQLGARCTLANQVSLAGHVQVGEGVSFGGHAAVHQFVSVGALAFIAANAMVSGDVPPYCLAAGDHATLRGLNTVGLRRAGVSAEARAQLKLAYHELLRGRAIQGGLSTLPRERYCSELLSFLASLERPQRARCKAQR